MIIHRAYYGTSPSESDPDGDDYILCGLEQAAHSVFNDKGVTCKKCLRRLNATPSTPVATIKEQT